MAQTYQWDGVREILTLGDEILSTDAGTDFAAIIYAPEAEVTPIQGGSAQVAWDSARLVTVTITCNPTGQNHAALSRLLLAQDAARLSPGRPVIPAVHKSLNDGAATAMELVITQRAEAGGGQAPPDRVWVLMGRWITRSPVVPIPSIPIA